MNTNTNMVNWKQIDGKMQDQTNYLNSQLLLQVDLYDEELNQFADIYDKLLNNLIQEYFNDDENLLNGKNVHKTKYIQLSEDVDQFIIGNQFYNTIFQYLIEITINHNTKKLTMTSTLAELDGSPIKLPQMIIKSLLRYSLRLNSQLRLGSFSINPKDGQLTFKVVTSFADHAYKRLYGKQDFFRYFKSLHSTSLYSLGYQLYRFAVLINKINIFYFTEVEAYLKELYNNSRQIRSLPQGALNLLTQIQELKDRKMYVDMSLLEKKQYSKYFIFPKPTQNNFLKIMNEIILHQDENPQNWENIPSQYEGGFALIKKLQIKYSIIQQPEVFLNRTLAMKSSISQNINNLQEEIKMLQFLSVNIENNSEFIGYCPYIVQTYYCKKIEQQNIYFMEYYQHLSLDNFKIKFNFILSLSSKLYILNCIALGLKYIHDNGVIHMDIKPGNILMSRSWIPKICDFGEARKIGLKRNMGKKTILSIGRTLPYAPPEIFDKDLTLNTTYDIYSFGMLMFEFIFDQYPIDFLSHNFQQLEKQLQEKTYRFQYNLEYLTKIGPQYIIKNIVEISINCLNPNPNKRPKLEWIITILREMLVYLDKMY